MLAVCRKPGFSCAVHVFETLIYFMSYEMLSAEMTAPICHIPAADDKDDWGLSIKVATS